MNIYEASLSALRGAGVDAEALCRASLIPAYAIVRLKEKSPRLNADDSVQCYQCIVEVRIFARAGLIELAETAENAMLAAGFTPGTRSDSFDGEYQIANTEWMALEEDKERWL